MPKISRVLVLLLAVGLVAACQPQVPVVSTSTPPGEALPDAASETSTPDAAPSATPAPAEATPVAEPAPGAALLDTTVQLGAGGGTTILPFTSPPMEAARVEVSSLGGVAAYDVQIIDMFGNVLASFGVDGSPGAAIDEITLPYAGDYQLTLSPQSGSASLQVVVMPLDEASGGQALDRVGASAPGEMRGERIVHAYTFPLMAGQVVALAVEPDDAPLATRLTLYGPDGRPRTDSTAGEIVGFVADEVGEYVALVENVGGAQGTYTFHLRAATEPPQAEGEPDVTAGRGYRVALAEGSPLSLTFDGALGDVLSVDVTSVEDLGVNIYVTSPFGQVIAYAMHGEAAGGRIAEMQLPYSGRYTVELRPAGSGEASFRLSMLGADALTGGGVFGTALSGTRTGRIAEVGVFHSYQFEAQAGDRISLRVISEATTGELDLALALIGPAGEQMVFADNSPGKRPSDPQIVNLELTQTGTYTAIVYALTDGTGLYDIQYERQE